MNGFAKLLADLFRPLPRSAEAHPTPPPAKKGSAELLRETNARTISRLKDMTVAHVDEQAREDIYKLFSENTGVLEPGVERPIAKHPLMGAPYGADAQTFQIRTDIESAPRNFLIFINGDPRSGKDTTSFAIEAAFKKRGYLADARSSIEPVREMLQKAGFDLSAKTEKDRYLLAEVGDRVEEHSEYRSRICRQWFRELARTGHEINTPVALVLHTREPATMHKIAFGLRNEMNLSIKTLFVSGRGVAVTSNKADAGVRGMVYDDEIRNDGTLAELEARVDSLVGSWTS